MFLLSAHNIRWIKMKNMNKIHSKTKHTKLKWPNDYKNGMKTERRMNTEPPWDGKRIKDEKTRKNKKWYRMTMVWLSTLVWYVMK